VHRDRVQPAYAQGILSPQITVKGASPLRGADPALIFHGKTPALARRTRGTPSLPAQTSAACVACILAQFAVAFSTGVLHWKIVCTVGLDL
jgi:hypothetical protein